MRSASSRAGITTDIDGRDSAVLRHPPKSTREWSALLESVRPELASDVGDAPEPGEGRQAGGEPQCEGEGTQRPPKLVHPTTSLAIMSATMRALDATSGSPPPGWLEPPTRYRPATGPRLAGRWNAARIPSDDVP